jgi:hypothetical protein
MTDPIDNIDEVALNVLLAEGVDLPTALEASRRGSGTESSRSGCAGVLILIIAAHTVIAAVLL